MSRPGPAPKDPSKRARRNADALAPAGFHEISVDPCPPPGLPATMPGGKEWPDETRTWWNVWAKSPLTSQYAAEDWSDLLDCAVLHGEFWSGTITVAPELRRRMASHGATADARAKLRIQFVTADDLEAASKAKRPTPAPVPGHTVLKAVD